MMDIEKFFEEHEDEFLEFSRIAKPLSTRPDLHAFLLLESIAPGKGDMVVSAERDVIWLSADPEEIAELATEVQLIDLIRCGVSYGEELFCMFV